MFSQKCCYKSCLWQLRTTKVQIATHLKHLACLLPGSSLIRSYTRSEDVLLNMTLWNSVIMLRHEVLELYSPTFYAISYCMVYAPLREDNPRALASGLSPVHTHNHTLTFLLHQYEFALCASIIFDVKY